MKLTELAFKTTKMLRIMELLVSKILALYCMNAKDCGPEVRTFFEKVSNLIATRGLPATIAYVKLSRNAVMRVISGRPLDSSDGVSLREGWPQWLLFLRPLVSTMEGKRILLTLLTSLRGVILKPQLDLGPIIDKWTGVSDIKLSEHRHACRVLGIRKKSVEWKRFHMSTKRGPLGQALLTSVTELTLLSSELLGYIYLVGGSSLRNVIEGLKVPRLKGYSIVDIWSTFFPPKRTTLRRISYFSDKEGKTRVIAILDYWSQTALRPLHDTLNSILRRIPSDCTFNQNHFLKCLPSHGPYYSIDLSNATDRMPVSVQERVIAEVIGKERAAAWVRILTGYEYAVQGLPLTVSYGCGQPMGAYSSWCAMALTHHYLVRISALRAGYPHFKDYSLLGDDLVIANAAVATEYRKLLTTLAMPVSEAKTHVSDDTYEFAKRWIHCGEEITGFAISGLKNVWKRYSLLHNFLETQQHHGWNLSPCKHPDLIRTIYTIYGRPEQSERVIKLYMVFNSLAKAKMVKDYSDVLTTLSEWFPGHLDPSHVELLKRNSTLSDVAKAVVVKAKEKLVERDLETFQSDAYKVNDRLDKDLAEKFPSLSGQEYRAALRICHPLVVVLNYLIDASMELLLRRFDPEADLTDFYLEAGLSKYHVSKGVFSMRASHSITLAQSMVVKSILDVIRDKEVGLGP